MVYLNNAATSWPKPSCVNEAVQACLMDTPASQFRGGSAILKKDVEVLCREAMGELLGIAESERIFFTSGATESLNTVLCGLDYGKAGNSILVTQTEHNSVLRPLMNQSALKEHPVKIISCTAIGAVTEELLEQYPKLIVVKSISKSYGVPGLRLGVLASGNETLIADLKKRAVIWNINSFAEYYMQIAEKYKKDYVAAMEKFREERAWLAGELEQIAHMRVYPTQANYFMVELLDGRRSGDVVRELLVHEQILLKDLTGKIKCGDRQFLRIAIRNRVENERMVRALENILK